MDRANTDFQNLVNLNLQPSYQVFDRKAYHPALKYRIRGGKHWNRASKVDKAKAHQDPAQFPEGSQERFLALGNEAADRVAKLAASSLHKPADEVVPRDSEELEAMRAFLQYVAKALCLWPPPTKARRNE